MEKDVVLLATTITHAGAFATDAQRVNVALTRARHHLIVLGSSQVLRSSSAAFRLLLSGCQMLPAGACPVLPSSLSNKSNLSSSRTTSAYIAGEHYHDNGEEYDLDGVPAQHQDVADMHEQAWASACSDVWDDFLLSAPAQKARDFDESSAAVMAGSKDLSLDVCPAVECPNQAAVKHLNQAVPLEDAAQATALPLTFDIDDI